MNRAVLRKHIESYKARANKDPKTFALELEERQERKTFYSSWTSARLSTMTAEEFLLFLAKLWAMRIWGNKEYVADKIIQDNGLEHLREALQRLLWGAEPVDSRWNWFRSSVKGMGPAMISELLCHVHPKECMLWNRRAYVAFRYLEIEDLPRYDYQLTGHRYEALSGHARSIARELENSGFANTDLLTVDYFLWQELQVEENLSKMHAKKGEPSQTSHLPEDSKANEFLHNDVRDKLADIGRWLGFTSSIEVTVAAGSKVDTIWEATIGNLGRVIYVFEVQTKGSIDSLIINLLKSLNNPAVQSVVAVSDGPQIQKIQSHASAVLGLQGKLKFWNYEEVLQVHESLSAVNERINKLGLVPEPF
jgi:hypothetical protein